MIIINEKSELRHIKNEEKKKLFKHCQMFALQYDQPFYFFFFFFYLWITVDKICLHARNKFNKMSSRYAGSLENSVNGTYNYF
jgi:hypothetical protein